MNEKRPRLTQAALAGRIPVTPSAVSGWLRGTEPYPRHVEKICDALGIKRDWLLYGEEPKYLTRTIVQEIAPPWADYDVISMINYIKDYAPESIPMLREYLLKILRHAQIGAHSGPPQKISGPSGPAQE